MKKIGGMAMVAAAVIILVSGGQAFSAERQNSHFFSAPGSWQYEAGRGGSLPMGRSFRRSPMGTKDLLFVNPAESHFAKRLTPSKFPVSIR